jgi:hypothetical protein
LGWGIERWRWFCRLYRRWAGGVEDREGGIPELFFAFAFQAIPDCFTTEAAGRFGLALFFPDGHALAGRQAVHPPLCAGHQSGSRAELQWLERDVLQARVDHKQAVIL